jgi:hypothetical protein
MNYLSVDSDNMGCSVAVSADSNTIYAGAFGYDSSRGTVFRFQLKTNFEWIHTNFITPDSTINDGSVQCFLFRGR